MDYHIIGFFIYQQWNYVIVKLISVCTTEIFHINSSFWCTLFKFILAYSAQMAATYNIRFLLFFRSNSSNVGFHSSWKFWGAEYILIFWVFVGNYKGTFRSFLQMFVSLFLVEVVSSITIILFSNFILFNLRIYFCTCSGTNANAKPLHFSMLSFTGMFILHVSLRYLVDLKPNNS